MELISVHHTQCILRAHGHPCLFATFYVLRTKLSLHYACKWYNWVTNCQNRS